MTRSADDLRFWALPRGASPLSPEQAAVVQERIRKMFPELARYMDEHKEWRGVK